MIITDVNFTVFTLNWILLLNEIALWTQLSHPSTRKKLTSRLLNLTHPDYKLEFEIPQRLVKRIYKKLKKGGLNYDDKQMTALLVKICVDEGTYRLERESVWGLMPMVDTAPPNFSIDAPFSFTSVADTYTFDDMPSLDGIQIKKLQMEISDELIEREIQSQKLECGNPPHRSLERLRLGMRFQEKLQ